ncbi:MAG: cytochrome c oxidase assembly factor Coa1 family protein [Pyrinomonadaceae bacterium]
MNLKVVGAIGCGAITVIFFVVVAIIFISVGAVMSGAKSTEEYKCALSLTKESNSAKELLGSNIEDGYWLIPEIKIENSDREISITSPVSGSKNSGYMVLTSKRTSSDNTFVLGITIDEKPTVLYSGVYPCKKN